MPADVMAGPLMKTEKGAESMSNKNILVIRLMKYDMLHSQPRLAGPVLRLAGIASAVLTVGCGAGIHKTDSHEFNTAWEEKEQ